MDPRIDSPPPRRLIDTEVKARVVAALRRGASREEVAAEAGFALNSLYNARDRDPLFRLAWEWAMDLYVLYARQAAPLPPAGDGVPVRIAPQGRRPLQRRRMNWVKFNESRQQIFLDHFAATADAGAAADKAGVCIGTVHSHRHRNPEFAAAWREALNHAVALLEAESVRQRLEAQQRLTRNLNPSGEVALEFERVMKLLQRWDRRNAAVDTRTPAEAQAWTFEEAIASLDRKLRALGLRTAAGAADAPGIGNDGTSENAA
jgi:hypothetical protein